MNHPREYFIDKWYIREDLVPEPFNVDHPSYGRLDYLNYMKNDIKNCFDSREQAYEYCNALRILVGIKPLINPPR